MEHRVLASSAADAAARGALARACERLPAVPEFVDDAARASRLREIAAEPGTRWIVLVDADVVPAPDAFGALRRALATNPALLGGRGLVAGHASYGAMFAPPRSGPQPFELAPIAGFTEERGLADILRGPVDVPQRGLLVVSAAFVRDLPAEIEIDASSPHLDLAVAARVAGATVVCEPGLSFASEPDGVAVRRRLLGLRRYARYDVWAVESLHRFPAAVRSRLIGRDTRVMGNFRGYQRRPPPPVERVRYGPRDVDRVRAALARTGDRYVLLAETGATVGAATVEALAGRLERSNRYAVALERDEPPHGAILIHAGRLVRGGTLRGDTVAALVLDLIARLPEDRLYAVGPAGVLAPAVLPPLPRATSICSIVVATCQPMVTHQTLQALLQEGIGSRTIAVFSAGSETTRRLLSTYGDVQQAPDAADPILAVGLNRALATVTEDVVAIVRDDVQVTRGCLERLRSAFDRVARLGVAVPRVGGADRPEGLPELAYDSIAELQQFAERRAASHAREAMLVDVGTTPILVVSRAVLEIVGGFDESFGFSRFGIEDFTRRVRAANFHVVRCDDAYAHLFPAGQIESLLAPLDTSASHLARYRERWAGERGFDAARDVVPLRGATLPAPDAAGIERTRLLVPVADEREWKAVLPFLAEVAGVFRAGDPLDVAIGLDGALQLAPVVADLRELLLRSGVAMEETVNVLVEPVGDRVAWRDVTAARVRPAAVTREELREVAVVADAAALRAQIAAAVNA